MKKLVYMLPTLLILGVLIVLKLTNKENLAVVEEREVKKVVYASGIAKPPDYVLIKSEVSGYVKEVYVKEGDKVRKGQVLALLDAGPLVDALEEAKVRKILVEEKLKKDSPYLKSIEEEIMQAQIRLEQEKKNLQRRENLYERGLIPKEQYEIAKTNYETALKSYEKLNAVYQDSVNSLMRERQALAAQVERISKEIQKYTIKSPIDGVVLNKFVNRGDYINALSQDNKLFSVGNVERWEVILDVDEEFVQWIKKGMRVYLTLDAFPDAGFEGTVEEIIRDVDRSRRVFQVKVLADLPPETPAGATVEANILVYSRKSLVIPKEAYKDGKVLKYEGVRFVEVPVKVGVEVDGYVEVLEGLRRGDKVKIP